MRVLVETIHQVRDELRVLDIATLGDAPRRLRQVYLRIWTSAAELQNGLFAEAAKIPLVTSCVAPET